MLEVLTYRISAYLVSVQAANMEDQEIIAYGLFHILASIQQVLILAVLSVVFKMAAEIFCYAICFTTLKRLIGGSHAGSHWACVCGFTAMAFAVCFVCLNLPPDTVFFFTMLLAFVMVTLVVIKAPIPHPKNPLSDKKRAKIRKQAIGVALAQFFAICIAIFILPERMHVFALCGAVGSGSAALTLILPMPGDKGGEK
ncbi:accessory gene regulator B family protein [Tyzzerella sp. OttesenSCG-928-J15]|nr:accessory gene regulator B family protein [Tyzzerella sp. OttesenSCG-928-J15]